MVQIKGTVAAKNRGRKKGSQSADMMDEGSCIKVVKNGGLYTGNAKMKWHQKGSHKKHSITGGGDMILGSPKKSGERDGFLKKSAKLSRAGLDRGSNLVAERGAWQRLSRPICPKTMRKAENARSRESRDYKEKTRKEKAGA